MRNQALTGYLLHHRAYQDKRSLCYFFTPDFGVIHGIGKRGLPLFECLQLFATGKRSLKNFSQIQLLSSQPAITGSQQYAALYLNEILYRLLPVEDPFVELWRQYESSLNQLRHPLTQGELRLCLRQFEHSLFHALGYEVLLTHDSTGEVIDPEASYCYQPDIGFERLDASVHESTVLQINDEHKPLLTGIQLLNMSTKGIDAQTLTLWSTINRRLIDYLLEYKPLQSRLLWQQHQRYQ